MIENFGCWKKRDGGGCVIIAQDARHSGDTERLRTIGLEVWKCAHNNREY